jgi:hypothetical protein
MASWASYLQPLQVRTFVSPDKLSGSEPAELILLCDKIFLKHLDLKFKASSGLLRDPGLYGCTKSCVSANRREAD